MLNPWRLRLLVQLASLGTMRAVAVAARLSPSTVSQQLAVLEREVGAQLLERSGRRVWLTAMGVQLAERSRPVLDELDGLAEWLHGQGDEVAGVVRVAAFSSVLGPVVLPAVARLRARFADLTVEVVEAEPDESLPWLDRGETDIVLSARFESDVAVADSGRTAVFLVSDELFAILPAGHRLAGRNSISVGDLAAETWALEPEGLYLANSVRQLCTAAGFEPRVEGVFRGYTSLQRYVEAGLAVTVLPRLAIDTNVGGVRILPLEPPVQRHVEAMTRPASLGRAAVRAVLDELASTPAGN